MTRRSSVLLPITLLILTGAPAFAAPPGAEDENPITARLAVQTALQQGRDHLLNGKYKDAVTVLESQIARINGSREYLTTLRDAYRAYIRQLQLAGDDKAAGEYLKRLRILEPGAVVDGSMARGANTLPPKPDKLPLPEKPIARGKAEDRDPFDPSNHELRRSPAWEKAELEFANRNYDAAAKLFSQAYQTDQAGDSGAMERWAYCKLFAVVQQLNAKTDTVNTTDLEREVRLAMTMAPRLDGYAKDLLKKIQDRARPETTRPAPDITVKHLGKQASGWAVAETTNFRILHKQTTDFAERVAQAAEKTRVAMFRKWVGTDEDDWNPRCEIYLHNTADDYNRATGVPTTSPGHSTIRSDGGRVVGRRIDLHCDDPNLLNAVLPHETTHVVIAGQFGDAPVPRWADEGMAVLTEPREKIEQHLRNLPRHRQDGQLFSVRQLMQLNDYPEPRRIGAFYAQSVSVVEFLSTQKSPETFTQFVRDGLKSGYERALKTHYNIADFNELDQRWRQHAFGDGEVAAKMPLKPR